MGNLCGKQSSDNFSQPGRTVGSAPPPQARAPVPKSAPKVTGPGRTVGGGSGGVGGGGEGAAVEDPRAAAARAAEERAKTQTHGRGKLGEQLAAQRRQTRGDTLEEASRETRGHRDADGNAVVRNYN